MRKQGAFYLIVGGLLGLALLITARPGLNPTPLGAQTLKVSETFRVSHLQEGTWTTYANGDAVQDMAIRGDTLWVATYLGGLVRWDTTDQTYVQYLYPQTNLPSNDVRAIDVDALGRVWVGTDRGLAVLLADGGTIVTHRMDRTDLPADDVTDLAIAPDGRVWIATDGGGLAVLDDKGTTQDLSDDEWTVYGLDDGLPSYRITALDFDEVGNLWIGTRPYPNPDPDGPPTIGGGLCVFDDPSFSCYSVGSNNVVTLCAGSGDEEMWVATSGGGVTLFQERQIIQTFNSSNSGLAANYVTACAQDAGGKMWFAASDAGEVGHGVSVFYNGVWATLTTMNSGLASDSVGAIATDSQRRVWFGHKDVRGGARGVSVLAASGETWTTYDMTTSRIPSERITSITQDTVGRLWCGSNGEGALVYLRDYDRWRGYDRNNTGSGLPSNIVRDIAVDQLGRLWFATGEGGSAHSGSWTAYTRETTEDGLRSDDLYTVAVDGTGKVWFGHAEGIDVLDHHGTPHDPSDDTWYYFDDELPGLNVRDIVRAPSDRMWVATNSGVGVYDGMEWKTYTAADSLISDDVQVVFPDGRDGQIWVGTAGGASVLDEDSGTWTSYTAADKLVDSDVQAIGVDAWRRVWFATSAGVSIKDGEAWITYTSTNSGLAADDITSLFAEAWWSVWLGTRNDGVSAFDSSLWDAFATADQGLASNRITDIVFGADGETWVATADRGLGVLRGTTWVIEAVDMFACGHPSLALDEDGQPHISYYDHTNRDLRYARRALQGTITPTPTSTLTATPTLTVAPTATATETATATPSPSPTPVMHRIWLPLIFSAASAAGPVIPNDPLFFPWQWNLNNTGQLGGTPDADIDAPEAWDITTGSREIIIAVLDSGVDLEHPDLVEKLWTNPGEIPDNGRDDDGNGYVDDIHGWDFVNWDNEPQDDDRGNGTAIAGIAAAATNNGQGIAGVSWGGKIMPLKALESGTGFVSDVILAINYAAENGARVINMSFVTLREDEAFRRAIEDAHEHGALLVAMAGDCGQGCFIGDDYYENPDFYPAAFDHVIAVGTTNQNDEREPNSEWGPYLDVMAPGELVPAPWYNLSYDNPHIYALFAPNLGSSAVAAPHVSGLAALIWSVNPDLSPDEVEDIIKASADKVGSDPYDESGRNDLYGYGRINAETALRMTPHKLWLEPEELIFLADDERALACRPVSNRGTNASTWEAMTTAEWLSVDGPLPTSLSPGLGLTPSWIDVCVVPDGLADYGSYSTVITATSTLTSTVNNPRPEIRRIWQSGESIVG